LAVVVSTVIVTVDIVGSTETKHRYDQQTAARKITATLNKVRDALCAADESLRCPVPYAGDSILLVGGLDHEAIWRAAARYQGGFRADYYDDLAVKIAIGLGVFESIKGDMDGQHSHHGRDLDELYAIAAWCPPARIVITQQFHSALEDAHPRYARRFHERTEWLKGFGERVFFQSNGEYTPPRNKRPRIKKGIYSVMPQTRGEFVAAMTVCGLFSAIGLAYWLYWMPSK